MVSKRDHLQHVSLHFILLYSERKNRLDLINRVLAQRLETFTSMGYRMSRYLIDGKHLLLLNTQIRQTK